MSIFSRVSSPPEVELRHKDGTRPRLAKSSSTRGITPGSARASTEKQAVAGRLLSATDAASCGMSVVLGGKAANSQSPNPRGARGRNSPIRPAMPHHQGHGKRCRLVRLCGQRAFEHLPPSNPNTAQALRLHQEARARSGSGMDVQRTAYRYKTVTVSPRGQRAPGANCARALALSTVVSQDPSRSDRLMNHPRLLLVTALALIAAVGCTGTGAPDRASDTQNLNAITDDISALTMTQSDVMHAADPMSSTVLPRHYQLPQE